MWIDYLMHVYCDLLLLVSFSLFLYLRGRCHILYLSILCMCIVLCMPCRLLYLVNKAVPNQTVMYSDHPT